MARRTVHTFGFEKKFAEVRERLKLTHETIAKRSEGAFDRIAVGRIESGENKLTTDSARDGISRALRVPREMINRALDEGKVTAEELVQAALRGGAGSKSTPPPPPTDGASGEKSQQSGGEFAHPAMRWRATVALAEDHEEGDALRAMLNVTDLSTDATWGDYYIAAKRRLGVDYAHDPASPSAPARAPRVNGRTQKRR